LHSGKLGSYPTSWPCLNATSFAKHGIIHLNSRLGIIGRDTSIDCKWRSLISSLIGSLRIEILEASLTFEIRSRLKDYERKGQVVTEATVQVEIYNEILNGTLPGYLRLLSSSGSDHTRGRDKWWRVRRRFREARRYRDIMRQLGYAGLVFMGSWFKRTWLTRTTIEEWASIMNVLQDGRSWFQEEVRRVFGDAAPEFLATLKCTSEMLKASLMCSVPSVNYGEVIRPSEDLIMMSTPSQITCLRPDQLPIWTSEDAATSSLDTLLLMAARMAFLFPGLYTQGKEYGSQVLRELTDNLLKLIQADRGRDMGTTWFHVNVEVLQDLRDRVRRDLGKERLVGGPKVIVGSHSSLESIERHVIPQQLVECALLFCTQCNSCGKEFEVDQATRTRGMHIVIGHDSDLSGDGILQEIINGSVRQLTR
jgi:hypothetical protein